ncbi:MAG TPA: phospholipid carrier-dependent glycosyltransferase [Bryobacteraceae bacterium]|nr:phospholipid carrier-dependent glycosyltransferase [Bryobacteraceae bacterium]
MGLEEQAQSAWADRRNVLLCALLFLIAAAATWPVLEAGVDDEWSYSHIALRLATTGHLAYDGFASPVLLPQLLWAAATIKLFGFSFLALRLSVMLTTVLLIPALYYLGRECGLRPSFAAFATSLTVFSPLVMVEAVSFMSDVPALFFFVCCLSCGLRAWKSNTIKASARWALLLSLTGALAGLERQIYWLAPLSFLPVLAWSKRRQNAAVVALTAVWILELLIALLVNRWFHAQPYAVNELASDGRSVSALNLLARRLLLTCQLALTAALILTPALVSFVAPGLRRVSRGAAVCIVLTAIALGLAGIHWSGLQAPWMEDVLKNPLRLAFSNRPHVLLGVRGIISVTVFLSIAGCGLALWPVWKRTNLKEQLRKSATPAIFFGLAFGAGWLPLVLSRSLSRLLFDRYLMTFLPLAGIPLLWIYQTHIRRSISPSAWCVLAIFALYGVAGTHDLFAAGGARLQATRSLEQAGIPRTAITAGLEFDGWTQVEAEGRVLGYFEAVERRASCTGPQSLRPFYLPRMPALRIRYLVSQARVPQLADVPGAAISYASWLSPGRRWIFTQVHPQGEFAECR